MAINRSVGQQMVSVAEAQLARVAGDGCARHPHLNALLDAAGPHSGRDVSDAVHLLCSIHGRYPGLIELALQRCPKGETQEWLARASEAFERERLYLVRLTAAVGPMPSTPGAAESKIEPGCRPPCAGNPGHVRTRWLCAWGCYRLGR